jgi:hypothetical protein
MEPFLITSAAEPLLRSLLSAIRYLRSTNPSCGLERELLIEHIFIRLVRLYHELKSLEESLPLKLKCRIVDIMRRFQYAIEKIITLAGYETMIMPSTTRHIPWAIKDESDIEAEIKSHQQMLQLAVDIMSLNISMNIQGAEAYTTKDREWILNDIARLKSQFPFDMGEPLDDNIILAKYLEWCVSDRYVDSRVDINSKS